MTDLSLACAYCQYPAKNCPSPGGATFLRNGQMFDDHVGNPYNYEFKQPLDYETLSNFTVNLRAQDQGRPPLHNDTTLFVEVLDADDQNPKFTHDHYTALLPDDAFEGTILVLTTAPGPIAAVDQDTGINAPLYYTVTGDKREMVLVDRETGRVAATRQLLEANEPVTVVIRIEEGGEKGAKQNIDFLGMPSTNYKRKS